MNDPQHITAGRTFVVTGDAWMTDNVTVRLKKADQVLLTGDCVSDHGHISLRLKCPVNLAPGTYTLEYAGADAETLRDAIIVDGLTD